MIARLDAIRVTFDWKREATVTLYLLPICEGKTLQIGNKQIDRIKDTAERLKAEIEDAF